VQDIRYAQKPYPTFPARKAKISANFLVAGPPQSGKTTAMSNLFASFTQDPAWKPASPEQLSADLFELNFSSVATELHCEDEARRFDITFRIIVRASVFYQVENAVEGTFIPLHLQPFSCLT
jgi:septin family protein